jgi:hypothetical protein
LFLRDTDDDPEMSGFQEVNGSTVNHICTPSTERRRTELDNKYSTSRERRSRPIFLCESSVLVTNSGGLWHKVHCEQATANHNGLQLEIGSQLAPVQSRLFFLLHPHSPLPTRLSLLFTTLYELARRLFDSTLVFSSLCHHHSHLYVSFIQFFYLFTSFDIPAFFRPFFFKGVRLWNVSTLVPGS